MNICNHEINVTALEPTIFLSLDINANKNCFCQKSEPLPRPLPNFHGNLQIIFQRSQQQVVINIDLHHQIFSCRIES